MDEQTDSTRDDRDNCREGVDRTLLRENLKLTVTERFQKHRNIARFVEKLRIAGQNLRGKH